MPNVLVEDPTALYMLLATAALALGVACWRTRQWKWGAAATGVVVVMVLVGILSQLIVTDREQIILNLQAMAEAATRRDMNAVFAHISKDFQYGTMDKSGFRGSTDDVIRRYSVRSITLWDFDAPEVSRATGKAKIEFRAKAIGSWSGGYDFYFVRSEFVLDPDGQWRMKTFTLYNPVDTRLEVVVPGLGR